jgi:hypothetical protein
VQAPATRDISQRELRGQASGLVRKLGAGLARLGAALVESLPELRAPRGATGLSNCGVGAAKPTAAVER